MAKLTRRQILDVDDIRREVLHIPEWGGEITVRSLTAEERDDFDTSCLVKNGNKRDFNTRNLRAKLCVRCIVDDDDQPLFSIEDIQRLGGKSASALTKVFEVAQRLSRIGDQHIEELAKNSETDQSAVSSSV